MSEDLYTLIGYQVEVTADWRRRQAEYLPHDERTIEEMSLALERVGHILGLKVIDDAATRLVAEKIIELSQHGMRGIATLHAMTVRQFKTE